MDNRGKVKFGIVGTGMIARVHAEALARLPQAELTVVYDQVRERAIAFAREYSCRAATDFTDFLASGIAVVSVATPSGRHCEVVLPAARAGKHVLCEKPLEVDLPRVDKMIRTCAENGVLLSAVFQSRFSQTAQLIKQAVDRGRFGDPVLASASVRWYRTPEYYASADWRGTWALDGGGALMNQGIHTIDLLLYFNGDVQSVAGRTARRLHRDIEVEDTVVAMVQFRNGSLGIIESSTACKPGFPKRIELSGTEGSVILEGDRIVRWQFSREQPEDEEIRRCGQAGEGMHGGSGDPRAITCEGHRRQFEDLAEAILKGRPLTIPGAEGRRAIALIRAIYEAANHLGSVNL